MGSIFLNSGGLLLIGAILISFELLTFSTMGGTLFVGIGYLLAAGALKLSMVDNVDEVLYLIGLGTIVSAAILWKPMKTIQNQKVEDVFESDFVGEQMTLPDDLDKGSVISMKYSGVYWDVSIHEKSEGAKKGDVVRIMSVGVGKLVVAV